jgi:hypothetical protein
MENLAAPHYFVQPASVKSTEAATEIRPKASPGDVTDARYMIYLVSAGARHLQDGVKKLSWLQNHDNHGRRRAHGFLDISARHGLGLDLIRNS